LDSREAKTVQACGTPQRGDYNRAGKFYGQKMAAGNNSQMDEDTEFTRTENHTTELPLRVDLMLFMVEHDPSEQPTANCG
jgi:hypothetical protein